ncbi:MAG: hypothetical protein M5U14_14090 [Acidimicrobiia bacterium]|nr:hypothetical protein [Acidimicrobiia bacterium]
MPARDAPADLRRIRGRPLPRLRGIWVEGGALDGFLARRELASWRPYHHADGRDPATRRRGRREQGFQLRLLGGGHVS